MIDFNWQNFSQLSTKQLYAILFLRSKVFIVEQNCVYSDVDGRDTAALHLSGTEKSSLVAYLRLFPPAAGDEFIIFGRVVTEKSVRSKAYGKKLMEELIHYCDANYPGIAIKCSAQHYLIRFYEKYGFKTHGPIYDEDGIAHIEMRRE